MSEKSKSGNNPMELSDTISFMTNADYKQRFIGEYLQTKIRLKKLRDLNNRIAAASMCNGANGVQMPEHDCPDILLVRQQKVMEQYLQILETRAIIEGIDLSVF